MKISERGQITIPKKLRDRYGLTEHVEVDLTPTREGVLIRKQTQVKHPVDTVRGILHNRSDADAYIEMIRDR